MEDKGFLLISQKVDHKEKKKSERKDKRTHDHSVGPTPKYQSSRNREQRKSRERNHQ